jgi:hypothetical protein
VVELVEFFGSFILNTDSRPESKRIIAGSIYFAESLRVGSQLPCEMLQVPQDNMHSANAPPVPVRMGTPNGVSTTSLCGGRQALSVDRKKRPVRVLKNDAISLMIG